MPTDSLSQPQPSEMNEEMIPNPEVIAETSASPDGEVPFMGLSDPGLEGQEMGEGEEAGVDAPEPIVYREMNAEELQASVEAVLFMNHKPLAISKLRELINPNIDEDDYRTAVSNLMAAYFDDAKGIELLEVANGFQFRTKAQHKDIIRRMYQIAPMKLTNAMLEVLAIVAYNQPATKDVIEKIRGVDSSHLFRVLLDKKMLRIVGKSDDIGHPMLYGTTKEFLELFGLRDLSALPSLRDIEDMLPKNEVGSISEEELLAQEMEGIVEESKPLEFNDLELLDLESHESEKTEITRAAGESLPPQQNSHSGAPSHGTATPGDSQGEGGGSDFDLPPETTRRFPLGPEGNA